MSPSFPETTLYLKSLVKTISDVCTLKRGFFILTASLEKRTYIIKLIERF